ncbi:MAG: AraC family transcriptional regulator, partial [Devosia sp.]|nr:AraC family transcriptional regulator [Devosia sp.]
MTMIETPSAVIETPSPSGTGAAKALLSDVLAHVRLTGALFLKGEYSAPWAFDSPGSCALVDLLSPGAERLIVFHTVRTGHLWISAGGHHVEFEAGDLAILPSAHRHLMGSTELVEPVPIQSMLPPTPWNEIPVLRIGGGGDVTGLVCGYFRCDELLFNAFLRSLPPVIKVRPVGVAATLLEAALSFALEDQVPAAGTAGEVRVPELLLVEALRLYSAQAPLATGWLAATNDPVVSRALKLMHDDPAHDWTVDDLARGAATSRSVLGERFKALLDQSPMRYLAEWRMQLAAN